MPVTRIKVAFGDGPLTVSPTWTDLSSIVTVREWSIDRGRANEFEKTGAGTATVSVIDRDGVLDPTNGASSLYPDVLPDKQIMIELYDPVEEEWQTRFRGLIEGFSYTLDPLRSFLTTTISAVDWFGWLNDQELYPYPTNGDDPALGDDPTTNYTVDRGSVFYLLGNIDDRINLILTEIGFPSALKEIFSGNVSIMPTVFPVGYQVLASLFDYADAEFPGVANLYVDREGILTFHGRQARFRPNVAAYGIRKQDVGDPSWTSVDDTVCPIAELGFQLDKGQLYNSVLAAPQEDDPAELEANMPGQLLEDATSITAHGKKSLSFTDLLTFQGLATGNTKWEETLLMATYYRDNYKDLSAGPRINRMVFKAREPAHRLSGPLWKMMCRSDISDLLTVKTEHPSAGGFGEDGYYIEGIRQTCRPLNPRIPWVELELDVSPQALFTTNPFDADTDPE